MFFLRCCALPLTSYLRQAMTVLDQVVTGFPHILFAVNHLGHGQNKAYTGGEASVPCPCLLGGNHLQKCWPGFQLSAPTTLYQEALWLQHLAVPAQGRMDVPVRERPQKAALSGGSSGRRLRPSLASGLLGGGGGGTEVHLCTVPSRLGYRQFPSGQLV